jgi:hypothetical protein
MQVTGVFDINNEIKLAVFKKWHEEDIASASADTSSKVTGWTQALSSTQTQALNPSFLNKVAEGWQTIKSHLWARPFITLPDSSLDITSLERCSLLFNEDVLRFCSENGISRECLSYYKAFIETFQNIQGITVTISHDYELPDYAKINFVLTLADEVENVIRHEDEFKSKIRREIDREKRRYFIYNYILV